MAEMRREGEVFVLDLGENENRFNDGFVAELEAFLDEIEAAAPCALVTTGSGKVYSNGLDLEWLMGQGEQAMEFVARLQRLLARLLGLGVPTVAAIQGHAYAGGAMLALAHDERVMRVDRGWFCLPEVELGMPFTPGMNLLIASRLAPKTAHEAMVTGRRYGGEEALAAGIVDRLAGDGEVLDAALARAAELAGPRPETLATIKGRLYGPAITALREPPVL